MREVRFMRELKILFLSGECQMLIYDKEKDSESEKAMWTIDSILYDLKPGEKVEIVCVR